MTLNKWTPTLEAIDKIQLEMYSKKEVIKEQERIIGIVNELFKSFGSGYFCGCYEGDLTDEYNSGVEDFVRLLKDKINQVKQ